MKNILILVFSVAILLFYSCTSCKVADPKKVYWLKNTSGHDVELLFYPEQATATIQKLTILQGSSTEVAYKNALGHDNSSVIFRPGYGGILAWHSGLIHRDLAGDIIYAKATLLFSDNKKIEYSFPCSPASLEVSPKNLLCRGGFVETNRIEVDSGPCGIVTRELEYTYTITKEDYQRAK